MYKNFDPANKRIGIRRCLSNAKALMGMVLGINNIEDTAVLNIRHPRHMGVTLIEGSQEPLSPNLALLPSKDLRQELHENIPTINQSLTVPIKGLEPFGDRNGKPLIWLTFDDSQLQAERQDIIGLFQYLDSRYIDSRPEYLPHLTIVQAESYDQAVQIIDRAEDHLPETVTLSKMVLRHFIQRSE